MSNCLTNSKGLVRLSRLIKYIDKCKTKCIYKYGLSQAQPKFIILSNNILVSGRYVTGCSGLVSSVARVYCQVGSKRPPFPVQISRFSGSIIFLLQANFVGGSVCQSLQYMHETTDFSTTFPNIQANKEICSYGKTSRPISVELCQKQNELCGP
jgi:hypothetical protein